jgi:hypothetical protein
VKVLQNLARDAMDAHGERIERFNLGTRAEVTREILGSMSRLWRTLGRISSSVPA